MKGIAYNTYHLFGKIPLSNAIAIYVLKEIYTPTCSETLTYFLTF